MISEHISLNLRLVAEKKRGKKIKRKKEEKKPNGTFNLTRNHKPTWRKPYNWTEDSKLSRVSQIKESNVKFSFIFLHFLGGQTQQAKKNLEKRLKKNTASIKVRDLTLPVEIATYAVAAVLVAVLSEFSWTLFHELWIMLLFWAGPYCVGRL